MTTTESPTILDVYGRDISDRHHVYGHDIPHRHHHTIPVGDVLPGDLVSLVGSSEGFFRVERLEHTPEMLYVVMTDAAHQLIGSHDIASYFHRELVEVIRAA